jgi:transposase
MRGADEQPGSMFSYVTLEERVPQDHPLREIRRITDRALDRLSPRFGALYVKFGRPSIAPEKLLRALLLQVLYTIRSERQLMEQLDYNLLFRWFVGLGSMTPCGRRRRSRRIGTGCWTATSRPRSSRQS